MNDTTQQKNFSIGPAKDPMTPVILQSRMDVLTHSDLTDGARAFFCLLLDLSLDSDFYDKERGRVVISTTKICELMNRSRRAVFGWKQELEKYRFIKCNRKPMPNCKPITRYWIAALHPKADMQQTLPGAGLYGNGKRVPDSTMPLGARGVHGCKKVTISSLLLDRFGKPVSSILLDNEPAPRTESTLPPAKFAGEWCTKEPCSPQNLREGECTKEPCSPQNLRVLPAELAGDNRKNQHSFLQSETLVPSPLSGLPDVQRVKDGPSPAPVRAVKGGFNAFGARKGFNQENDFLEDVKATLTDWDAKWAAQEMKNSGGWWRTQFRKHPDVMPRVLAEIGVMIKEGTIKTNPGAAAVDLMGRWAK